MKTLHVNSWSVLVRRVFWNSTIRRWLLKHDIMIVSRTKHEVRWAAACSRLNNCNDQKEIEYQEGVAQTTRGFLNDGDPDYHERMK